MWKTVVSYSLNRLHCTPIYRFVYGENYFSREYFAEKGGRGPENTKIQAYLGCFITRLPQYFGLRSGLIDGRSVPR